MILPIGHEGTGVRRLPWVTFTIIFINIIVFFFTNEADKRIKNDLKDETVKIIKYYVDHHYLTLDQFNKEDLGFDEQSNTIKKWAELNRDSNVPDEETMDAEQEHLDNLIKKLKVIREDHPFWKYGLISAHRTLPSLLFYFFIHAGWLHLLGNLLFLYIMGPFLEDVWGRPIYAVFYILSGILSGWMYTLHYPDFTGPLVGASGAISAVISAFLFRYWKTRIKFVYWVYFFIGTFSAPAWMLLIFEVARELLYANLNDSMSGSGAGVAYWAHIWGLAFGLIVALIIKKFDIEKRFITPVIDNELRFVDKEFDVYERAKELGENGQTGEAFDELKSISTASRKLPEIGEEMWNMGIALGREMEAAPVLMMSIESQIIKGQTERALSNYVQLRSRFPDTELKDVSMKLKLLSRMIVEEDGPGAEEFIMEIMNEVSSASPAGVLLEACNVIWEFDKRFNRSVSKPILQAAILNPNVPEGKKEKLREAVNSIS